MRMREALAIGRWRQGWRAIVPATATSARWLGGAGVDTHPDLDQLELEAIEGSVGHGLGQLDAAQ